MADLDNMLTGLDETVIAQQIELRVDMALKNFPVSSPIVGSYPDAEILVANFYKYLMQDLFGATVSESLARGFTFLLMSRAFPGGVDDAADSATTGVNGGVLALLTKVSEAIKSQLVDQYVNGTISMNCNLADWDDREALAQAYVNKFGVNLPPQAKRKVAAQLAGRVDSTIKNHMQIASFFRKGIGK